MKKTIVIMLAVLVCGVTSVYAEEAIFKIDKTEYNDVEFYKNHEVLFKINFDDSEESITIVLKNGTKFKIHKCGKVDKRIWKEINPNEDQFTITTTPGIMFTPNPSTLEYRGN